MHLPVLSHVLHPHRRAHRPSSPSPFLTLSTFGSGPIAVVQHGTKLKLSTLTLSPYQASARDREPTPPG